MFSFSFFDSLTVALPRHVPPSIEAAAPPPQSPPYPEVAVLMGLIIGLAVGAITVWFVESHSRRRLKEAIEKKQRLQQEKQLVVEFMHDMVEAVGECVDPEELHGRIVRAAVRSTGAMSACVFECVGGSQLKGVAVEGLFPPQRRLPRDLQTKLVTRTKFIESVLRRESFQLGEGLVGSVAKYRRGVLIPDAENDPRIIQHEDPALRISSIIVTPILFREELLGVLAVANPSDELSFTETDFSLVQSLADQAGLAINNSRILTVQLEKKKLDLDLELASSIQGLLLPGSIPSAEKLDLATLYQPAQKVGGDLYDAFEISPNRIGLAVADVSGKGISASILMAICQTNLRHFGRMHESPAEVLRAINRQMQSAMRTDMFVTVVFAIIDFERNLLTIARAGHELPILLRKGKERPLVAEELRTEGMAIGMVPAEIFDLTISESAYPFESGDALVLYTDGITETVNDENTEYGTSRMIDALLNVGPRSADLLIESIVKGVERFAGENRPTDDVTLLVARYR